MITAVARGLARALLRLRYRIRVTGLDAVVARGTRGVLFLPNHPALIDPAIVMTELHRRFQPRPLADRDQIDRPVVRSLAKLVRVIPMLDPAVYGARGQADVERAIAVCIEALNQGDNLILYPAGRIMRQRETDLAGNSAVETILREAPGIRVVLVRTTGLWGSGFGRASGHAPRLGALARRATGAILANGIFFGPRRPVSIEFAEPADLPRQADRSTLNRALETFYNREAPPATYVPYTWWEAGGSRELPEPDSVRADRRLLDEIPAATRELVMGHLREVTGRSHIDLEDQLSRDLGLDSLALVDLAVWIENEFGFPVGDGGGLARVEDVLLAARGQFGAAVPVELKAVPAAWFEQSGAAGRAGVPCGATLLDVLIDQVRQGPGRVVLADPASGVKTYREAITAILVLKTEIERLAGDYIGIMLPASAGAGLVYFAVLAAGKIPVMVNWTVGVRNMTHSLDLLGVRHVLTAGALVQRLEDQTEGLASLKPRFVLLEELVRRVGWRRNVTALVRSRVGWVGILRSARRHETAVVLFTSGSESLPKAVPLTHVNILTNLKDLCRVFEFRHDDRLIGMLPPFHSFGLVITTVLPLLSGVPVVYHPNPTEGTMLARLIQAYRVTLLVGTPTFLNGIVRAVKSDELDSLRAVISGAEKCPEQLYELVRKLWPQVSVVEGYGITECSPVVSVNDVIAPQPGTIGKALPSVEYAIVEANGGSRVERGQQGLLLVRGPSIFGGYLNFDGASPFVEFDGRTWYRTGDLVTEAADGVLTFAGRLKRFVKFGGEMISLPAIEEVLNRHYGRASDEGPVLAVEATPVELNPELVLFTIREVEREEVNRCLREAGLSALYNIRTVVQLEAIPVLGTGKTDYRALKERLKEPVLGA